MQLFRAESLVQQRLNWFLVLARLRVVLWGVYGVITAVVTALLLLCGSGHFKCDPRHVDGSDSWIFSPLADSVGGLGSTSRSMSSSDLCLWGEFCLASSSAP